ncbi:MAG: hypothetical protein ACPLKS_04850, partial [Caldisericum exile]|uniref:hypothetical protein n=1 Tax=Caldisericum exile TaxID=693075 RepID=UPI003C71F6E7
ELTKERVIGGMLSLVKIETKEVEVRAEYYPLIEEIYIVETHKEAPTFLLSIQKLEGYDRKCSEIKT